MATVVKYSGGLKRIEFSTTPNGPRKIIRLGRISSKVAVVWKAKIEAIIGDQLANRPHDAEISSWLGGLDDTTLGRLRIVGLANGVGLSQVTLGTFMGQLFAMMTGKPGTRVFYGHTRKNLEVFFNSARLMRNITPADADAWRAWLVEHEKLSLATVSRRMVAARTMWRKAIRWKFTLENPFIGIATGNQTNDAHKFFITRDVVEKVIAEAPDAEWKAIIALSRYGGLRCPSEPYALRWGDIDWHRGTVRVPCPKLEHREGHAYRIVPLFPELREHLLKLFEETPEGEEHVIRKYRGGPLNLRTQFERIIISAGVEPWPKPWHNLRASRETELMREYDLATVCKWIGNSPAIAAKHYAMSVDLNADFRNAVGHPSEQAQQNAQWSPATVNDHHETTQPRTNEKTPDNRGSVVSSPSLGNAGKRGKWARQDSNL